ncbi:MAG TPA: 16S rRNA (cytosine(1402)-N(4))-methyltransferase [Elusimicrobia bacterium]|nr:16S rRNA (cytosine(1402)-N(4))-methyltransferase [Elusimicrobiota bacterium]
MKTITTRSIRAYDNSRAANYRMMMKTAGYGSYRHLLDAISYGLHVNLLPENAIIIDLGCGTGNLSRNILREFPRARIIGVDGSESMLKIACSRFSKTGNISFLRRNFGKADWIDNLPAANAVISSGAIHHLNDRQKRSLYGQIYSLLSHGGLFINGDIIKGGNPEIQKMYEDFWLNMIIKGMEKYTGITVARNKIRAQHLEIQKNEGDRPGTLDRQLAWLRESGFKTVECYWKLFGFAVFGGVKEK